MPGLTIRGVNCRLAHLENSPAIIRRWPESGPEVDVRFQCAWSDAPALASALLGYVSLQDDGSIARTPPYKLPWAPQLYARSISEDGCLTPRGSSDGWDTFDISQITCTFACLKWQVSADDPNGRVDASGLPYTTTKFRVSAEQYSPPTGAYFLGPFPSTNQLPQGTVGLIRPNVEVNMLRHWMGKIPLEESILLVGCVNDAAIKLANRTFPRGCLLFNGMETDPTNDSTGFPVFDIPFNFAGHQSVEWNQIMGEDGEYHFLNTAADGSGDFPYPYEDFSSLFTD